MTFPENILRQLGNPSGLFGRFVLWRLNSANRGMNNLAYETLDLADEDHVLEIGFGGGVLLGRVLSGGIAAVSGAEISELAVQSATRRYRDAVDKGILHLAICDGVSLPFENDAFSRVVCVNVIYFWSDFPAMISEAHRVLAEDGKFVVCYQENAPDGLTKFPPKLVEKHLKTAGFAEVTTTDGLDKENGTYHCTVATKLKAE